jgi:hypothetical protein
MHATSREGVGWMGSMYLHTIMHVCSLTFSLFLSVTSEEYKLLHRLNQVTIAKYQDMTALAGRLNEVSQRLNDKCKLIHSF